MGSLDRKGEASLLGRALPFRVEVFNVGGWLAHGDHACSADVDCLGVGEHRLPAKVRHEWSRLRKDGIHSVWSASQEVSHVGQAGSGVVSFRGALVSFPSFATSQFRVFCEQGRQGGGGLFFHWDVGGVCILLLCMMIRGLVLMRKPLLRRGSNLMLC